MRRRRTGALANGRFFVAIPAPFPAMPLSWCMRGPVMPKHSRTFLAAVAAACAVSPAPTASAASAADDKAIYDRIVSLAGDWTGHMEDPLAGPPVTVRYEVASGGKAVIEYQNPAGSLPSATVYFLSNDKVRAVQYSLAGYQPAFKLGDETAAFLVLLGFVCGSWFDAA